MRIAWLTYLDPFCFSWGGELQNRTLIEAGRARGHRITVSPWLRGRPQRALRRLGLARRVRVDWDADLFVIADVRNVPQRRDQYPARVLERALDTGRAVVLADAWLDVCRFDLPCGGDLARCRSDCDRSWANAAYRRARAAVFVSPMQAELIAGVLDAPLPRVVYSRPPIDVESFRDRGEARDIDILYVGTVSEAKGYRNLVERFGAERLTLAGRNMLSEPVAGTYLGELPYEELPALYNRARTFAHLPNRYEPMSRAVVEASLCGCDLVTNDRVGVLSYPRADWADPEVVRSNPSRFWVELEEALSSSSAVDAGAA